MVSALDLQGLDDLAGLNDSLVLNFNQALAERSVAESAGYDYDVDYAIPIGYSTLTLRGNHFEYDNTAQGTVRSFEVTGDSTTLAVELNRTDHRSDIVQTAGHEFQHVNGVSNEWLADLGGMSTSLAFDAAARRDNTILAGYQSALGDGRDPVSQQANAALLDLTAGEKAKLEPGAMASLALTSAAKAIANLPSTLPNNGIMAVEGLYNLGKCVVGDCTDYSSLFRVPPLAETNDVEDIIGASLLAPVEILVSDKLAGSMSKLGGAKSKTSDVVDSSSGIVTSNGLRVTGSTSHGVDRAIGNGADRIGVSPAEILDALKNPLKVGEVKVDSLGRPSQRFTGASGEVVVNPETGKVISVNPTSTKKAARLKRQQEKLDD